MARRQKREDGSMGVYKDFNGRTCLLVGNDPIQFIPLEIVDGFKVYETTKESFHQRYKCMPNYPMDKAAQLYLNYSLAVGATDEVIDHLSKFINITDEDRTMATSKRAAPEKAAKTKTTEKPARKQRAKKQPTVKESKPTDKPSRKRRAKSKVESEYSSASQMFQGLIMGGELTDDEIFTQVQEAFGLDDKKRSYVTWYRNNLKKKGENPPEAK